MSKSKNELKAPRPRVIISQSIKKAPLDYISPQLKPEERFDRYYKKVYNSNFNGDSPSLKRKICNSGYSKDFENYAKKKIIFEEQLKSKNLQSSTNKSELKEENSLNSSLFSHVNRDYTKTIIKNKGIYISALKNEKRLGFMLNKKDDRPNTASPKNTYNRINKEWVDEFFWKKVNSQVPLPNKSQANNIFIKDAIKTQDISDIKSYRTFNTQFMNKINFLSGFKKDFEKSNNVLEAKLSKSKNDNQENLNICLQEFSKHLFDENLELKLQNLHYETGIIKKIFKFQSFLTESLLLNDNEELAKISDLIFKMMCVLYDNAHEI